MEGMRMQTFRSTTETLRRLHKPDGLKLATQKLEVCDLEKWQTDRYKDNSTEDKWN
jgi:hypothetical protein